MKKTELKEKIKLRDRVIGTAARIIKIQSARIFTLELEARGLRRNCKGEIEAI